MDFSFSEVGIELRERPLADVEKHPFVIAFDFSVMAHPAIVAVVDVSNSALVRDVYRLHAGSVHKLDSHEYQYQQPNYRENDLHVCDP
jgi:hypothetical protein